MGQEAGTKPISLRRWVAAVLVLAIVAAVIHTSGILPKDKQPLRISGQGTDTFVVIGGKSFTVEGESWPAAPTEMSIQVAGWTASASCPNPGMDIGRPGYLYIDYNGRGVTTLEVGRCKLEYRHRLGTLTASEL